MGRALQTVADRSLEFLEEKEYENQGIIQFTELIKKVKISILLKIMRNGNLHELGDILIELVKYILDQLIEKNYRIIQ